MKSLPHPSPDRGFTRTDLCAVLMAVALLAFIALPALGKMKPHSARASCANNLRQLGVGWHSWAKENGNKPPWHVPPVDGGTKAIPMPYRHFAIISNYVASPAIMVCPSDKVKIAARDFSNDPAKGLLSTNFENKAIGYFIGAELTMDEPKTMMAGDRTVTKNVYGNCTYIGVLTSRLRAPTNWTKEAHEGRMGNLLFSDGSVRAVDDGGLAKAVLDNPLDPNKSGCALVP
jgi:prepilin-type processing-associated H-X9-DG protein